MRQHNGTFECLPLRLVDDGSRATLPDGPLKVGNFNSIPLLNPVIISFTNKGKRDDAKVNEVGPMNSLNRLNHHSPDAEIHRTERCMFSRGSLSVAETRYDDVRLSLISNLTCTVMKRWIDHFKSELRVLRGVGPIHHPRSARLNMVRRYPIAELDRNLSVQTIWKRRADWHPTHVGTPVNIYLFRPLSRGDKEAVIGDESFRHGFHMGIRYT